jgi:asparagine synthase (glutamine-hydrolysing)
MCGIAGAVGSIDEVVRAAVRAMTDGQKHRGPDAGAVWEDVAPDGTGVVLGHRRLSIIDLSHAADQPMIDPASGQAVCFNGEIYNFRPLRSELSGQAFETGSDTEVLLRACGRWGAEALPRLRGMFAFAHWDPAGRRLLLARDRLGIKPLYCARLSRPGGRSCLLFASEVRALLASGLVERRLDPAGLGTYLWNGFAVGPATMIRGVQSLDPGTALLVDAADPAIHPRRYWQVPAARAGSRDRGALAAALVEAVQQHLVADVPLGVFLSGGIDSSAVAALAVRGGASSVRTFTVSFEEQEFDESRHARAVADALGTEHREIPLSERSFRDQLGDALGSLDQPTFDAINTYFVSRAVREAGITVALAGTGGDELFGGYRSFAEIPRALRWSRALRGVPETWLRAAVRGARLAAAGSAAGVPPQTRWGKLGDVLATRGRLVALYQVFYALFTEAFQAELRAGERSFGILHGLPIERLEALERWTADQPSLHAISILELSAFLGERLLRDTDTASMAVSLEVRVPLLDHEVLEAAGALDATARFEPLGRKQVLRDLALGGLDPRLFERPKSGFVLPIERWCRQLLRDEVEASLEDAALCESTGLAPEAVARLWRAFQAGAPGLYWSRIWALFVLLHWCRTHSVRL